MNHADRIKSIQERTMLNLVHAQTRLALFQAIAPVLKSFEGKKITKRIATAVDKAVNLTSNEDTGRFVAVLNWSGAGQFTMAYLEVWGRGMPFDERVHLFLGYGGELDGEKADISGWIKSTEDYIAGTSAALENLEALVELHDSAMRDFEAAKRKCKHIEGLDWRV